MLYHCTSFPQVVTQTCPDSRAASSHSKSIIQIDIDNEWLM